MVLLTDLNQGSQSFVGGGGGNGGIVKVSVTVLNVVQDHMSGLFTVPYIQI